MKVRNIKIIVLLASIMMVLVVINQYFWVKKDIDFQDNLIEIQKKNNSQSEKLFDTQVTLAIINVRDRLLSLNKELSGLELEPIKKITENYYVASFYDTINPDLLKNLLVEQFKNYKINEVFEYGIYDCFADSIIFDQYVGLSIEQHKNETAPPHLTKWNHDGHYFGVYFPFKKKKELFKGEVFPRSLVFSSLIIFFAILIFSYAIMTIIKQDKLSQLKTDFVNNMTHELKTPIATIKLSSDVLLKKNITCDAERINRYAGIIKSENSRLESQVERVLQMAKLEQDNIPLNKEPIYLHEIIRRASEVYRHDVLEKDGLISLDLEAENDLIIGDKVHITNIIYNLIDNAIKYTLGSPFITISTLSNAGKIFISIEDNGIGIERKEIQYIFDRFYRVKSGDKHETKGFGIGLYYVKSVVNQHGGDIKVTSKKGNGSNFIIILPLSNK